MSHRSSGVRIGIATVLVVALCALATGASAGMHVGAGGLRAADWWGGTYRTDAGEAVRVYVSDLYPVDEAKARNWVDFLAGLVHGPELSRLTVYVAPGSAVSRMCGADALGCYAPDDESITVIGDEVELPDPLTVEQVLAHEYGHHVANNRRNPPWRALDRGTKRWSSAVNVCARVREGSAGDRYDRDPAEAYAESYRVLVDRGRGLPLTWPIVDASFVPGPKALAAIRQDVITPWAPTTMRTRGRLAVRGVTRFRVTTPYDGTITARVFSATGLRAGLSLIASADAEPTGGTGRATRTICGERHVHVVVRALAGAGSFTLLVTRP